MYTNEHGLTYCNHAWLSSWGYVNKDRCWFAIEFNQQTDPEPIIERIKTCAGVQSVIKDDMVWANYKTRYYDENCDHRVNRYIVSIDHKSYRHLIRYNISAILDYGADCLPDHLITYDTMW